MTSTTDSRSADASGARPDGSRSGGSAAGTCSGEPPFETPLDSIVSGLEYVEAEKRRIEAIGMAFLAQAARIGARVTEFERRSIRAELATALHVSEHTIANRLALAASLMHEYPTVHTAIETGGVSVEHARVIVDAGAIIGAGNFSDQGARTDSGRGATNEGLPTDERLALVQTNRDEYAARVLVHAVKVTPARLRPIARRIAEEYAEISLNERHERAAARRQVCVYDAEDGMADLYAHLPAVEAYAIYDRLTQVSRKITLAEALATCDTEDAQGHRARWVAPEDASDGVTDRNNLGSDGVDGDDDAGEDSTASRDSGNTDDGEVPPSEGESNEPVKKRTMDELRADVFADLLLASDSPMIAGCAAASIRGRVQVVVPAAAVGLDDTGSPGAGSTAKPAATGSAATGPTPTESDATGEYSFPSNAARAAGAGTAGRTSDRNSESDWESVPAPAPVSVSMKHGPIPNTTARFLAGTASHWENVTATPGTGDVLRVDRYRPSERMRRTLAARDLHCRFPGCRAPLVRCDIDHTVDAAKGGETATSNLAHLCRGHHLLKHQTEWRVTQLPGGVMRWESPTGRVHYDRPPSRVYFQGAGYEPPKPEDPWARWAGVYAAGTRGGAGTERDSKTRRGRPTSAASRGKSGAETPAPY